MSKAMVVDDSRTIRIILAKMLSELGFEVCPAAGGKEALEVVERENGNFSAIMADWNMPEMNGLELVKQLRSDPRLSAVPIMMITTETETRQVMAALEAGANEYVMKPFSRDIIADKLRLMGVLE
ncbi:MAG TPA: response regulator [Acidobacteriaceae bacterium]|nr:response regulator [Acidobacteriaceae bacterium]